MGPWGLVVRCLAAVNKKIHYTQRTPSSAVDSQSLLGTRVRPDIAQSDLACRRRCGTHKYYHLQSCAVQAGLVAGCRRALVDDDYTRHGVLLALPQAQLVVAPAVTQQPARRPLVIVGAQPPCPGFTLGAMHA